ncbi:hypothetical protein SAY87_028353 [Trapa incisa]|uniref:Kinetochore protein SPC25 n=1 Tax=Trapa incisa TaxID=236973 RepID=A0AAN7KVI3_9MYRT|nr:hypothetical protein SAY87_028353 [Trapa incisa]
MQVKEDESTRKKMESLRLMCDKEIAIHQRQVETFASSFFISLESMKDKSQETIQCQGRLSELKRSLKEAENELVGALAAKTRSEAKRMAILELISAVRTRVEEHKRVMQEQKARRDEYAAIISRESLDLAAAEENNGQETKLKEDVQEAISWYNRVLCLRIKGGSGVKFMFNNVDMKRPDAVFSFTIHHANDTYTLLQCDPPVDSTKELVLQLNKSNDLYKFVRIMRRKFQQAAKEGYPGMNVELLQLVQQIVLGKLEQFSATHHHENTIKDDSLLRLFILMGIGMV